MQLAPDGENDKATAAINIVQSLGAAFGAALAGVVANGAGLVTPGGVEGAISAGFWLYVLFAIPGAFAMIAGFRIMQKSPTMAANRFLRSLNAIGGSDASAAHRGSIVIRCPTTSQKLRFLIVRSAIRAK